MDKFYGKEMPWEQQRDLLVEFTALQLPRLYQQLIMAYGEEKGQEIYEKIYEVEWSMRSSQFIGKDVGEVMLAEIDIFPALGWKLWIEKKVENGVTFWYEHLEHCPCLEAARKYKLPDPCPIVCGMDSKLAEKNKVGKWQRLKHIPSGDSECCFKITNFT